MGRVKKGRKGEERKRKERNEGTIYLPTDFFQNYNLFFLIIYMIPLTYLHFLNYPKSPYNHFLFADDNDYSLYYLNIF